jgi:phosphoserine phosphatase
MSTIILQSEALSLAAAQSIAIKLQGQLQSARRYCKINTSKDVSKEELTALRDEHAFDINVLPAGFDPQQIKLLIMDMDSTLISIECIDEIADFINVKPQVSEITEAAMRGELDFAGSLTKRVGLLTGLNTSALEHVYNERLQLNPGAEKLLSELKKRGIKLALVSGGFTYFTHRLQERLSLDYTLANVLDIEDGKLTGKVVGGIVDAEAKKHFLEELARELDISTQQAIAIGDGANDLKMMEVAGLSVAYHAKPAVQAQAATALNSCGLDGVLAFMGIDV